MATLELATAESKKLHEQAIRFMPKGVTGEGRWMAPYPIALASAKGKHLIDVDGNTYLDYHAGLGTAVLGYSHPEVNEAVRRATEDVGTFLGLPHPAEEALARRLCDLLPIAERVAFCGGGGSDAIYHGIRLARATTGRTKIVKIEGGYNGWHADVGVSTRPVLVDASKVGRPDGVPNSPGSLPSVTSEVLLLTVNDEQALSELFAERGEEIATMIIEPAMFSLGCVIPDRSYLELARRLCTEYGSVLMYDEIMSGFRTGLGGAGARQGVAADLGAFGKALANGYIISVLAGNASLMQELSPEGPVFYSGTFNGHPLSVSAALATLDVLEREKVPERIDELGKRLALGINEAIDELELNAVCQEFGSVWTLYFNTRSVRDFREFAQSDTPDIEELNVEYLAFLRENGIYMLRRHNASSRGFVSGMHEIEDIDRTVEVIRSFLELHRDKLRRRS